MIDVINKLIEKDISISFAESCTGGSLASALTKVPGVSKIFNGSFVTYSNDFKEEILGINKELIDKLGVVSKEVSIDMALNLKRITNADICVSTTGNAGPTKGDINKELGLVYVCIVYRENINTYELNLVGERVEIINQVVEFVYKKIDEII